MKKITAILLTSVILMCAVIIPAGAVQQSTTQTTEIIHTEFGDIEKISAVFVFDSAARSSSRTVKATDTYKYDGKIIAEVALTATFGYDGTTAWVTSANSSFSTYDRWVYGNERITKSGGTASLSATLSHAIHGTLAVNISITCSPTGAIT